RQAHHLLLRVRRALSHGGSRRAGCRGGLGPPYRRRHRRLEKGRRRARALGAVGWAKARACPFHTIISPGDFAPAWGWLDFSSTRGHGATSVIRKGTRLGPR